MHESSKLGKKSFFQKISFSWVGKKCLLRPQSQKKTKYCWAYASIGAMSAAVSIKSKKVVVPLSKQHLTDCLLEYYPDPKKEAKLKEGETYGSSCSKAYRFVVEQGIAEEESYSYAMRRGTCKCTETMCPWLVNSWFEYFVSQEVECLEVGVGIGRGFRSPR
ncbi:hypothetical protein BC332_34302 [Capsicum chinense]|nr:hypothetical protein BC332_34302 [Capsicum chinense]